LVSNFPWKNIEVFKKIKFHFSLIIISILLGLICELVYGQFQHYRYWDVTIYKVQVRQVNALESMISLLNSKIRNGSDIDLEELKVAFKPVSDRTPISIYKNEELIYSSAVAEFKIKENSEKEVFLKNLKITLGIYEPPEWIVFPGGYFFKWLSHPLEWFGDKYIHITVPLLGFSFVIYLLLLVIAFRSRAKFLSNEVLSSLDFLKEHRLNKFNEK
jgi:hypothetical protein